MGANCAGTYTDTAACMAACAIFPDDASLAMSGNSRQCRAYHAGAPAKADKVTHCPHATELSGSNVCGNACDAYCNRMLATCGSVYADRATCNRACAAFPAGTAADKAGNTLGCRYYHVGVGGGSAALATTHCPHAAAVSGSNVCGSHGAPAGVPRGGKVCYSGFVMDKLCSVRGMMLDNPSLRTLQSPERHSLHCLVDVPQCYNSGFEVLAPAAAGGSGFCRAFDLGSAGTTTMLAFARAQGKSGSCSTCTNTVGVSHGFKATVVGTVMTPATSGAAAVLENVQALAHGAACPEGYTQTAAPVEDSSLCLATPPPTAAPATTTTTAVPMTTGAPTPTTAAPTTTGGDGTFTFQQQSFASSDCSGTRTSCFPDAVATSGTCFAQQMPSGFTNSFTIKGTCGAAVMRVYESSATCTGGFTDNPSMDINTILASANADNCIVKSGKPGSEKLTTSCSGNPGSNYPMPGGGMPGNYTMSGGNWGGNVTMPGNNGTIGPDAINAWCTAHKQCSAHGGDAAGQAACANDAACKWNAETNKCDTNAAMGLMFNGIIFSEAARCGTAMDAARCGAAKGCIWQSSGGQGGCNVDSRSLMTSCYAGGGGSGAALTMPQVCSEMMRCGKGSAGGAPACSAIGGGCSWTPAEMNADNSTKEDARCDVPMSVGMGMGVLMQTKNAACGVFPATACAAKDGADDFCMWSGSLCEVDRAAMMGSCYSGGGESGFAPVTMPEVCAEFVRCGAGTNAAECSTIGGGCAWEEATQTLYGSEPAKCDVPSAFEQRVFGLMQTKNAACGALDSAFACAAKGGADDFCMWDAMGSSCMMNSEAMEASCSGGNPGSNYTMPGGGMPAADDNGGAPPVPWRKWTWVAIKPMSTARSGLGLAVFGGSKMCAVGGENSKVSALASAECFDFGAQAWAAFKPMSTARTGLGLVVFNSTKMCAVGGFSTNGYPVASAECFDSSTQAWAALPPMSTPRGSLGLVVFGTKMCAVGGVKGYPDGTGKNILASAECFDFSAQAWAAMKPMSRARTDLGLVVFNGKMCAAGGESPNNDPSPGSFATVSLASVECYDSSAQAWTALKPMHCERGFGTLDGGTSLGLAVFGGKMCAVGAAANCLGGDSTGECYDSSTQAWAAVAPMTMIIDDFDTIFGLGLVVFNGTKMCAVGGVGYSIPILASAECYTPSPPTPAGEVAAWRAVFDGLRWPGRNTSEPCRTEPCTCTSWVSCNANSSVTGLSLAARGLSGAFPAAISAFPLLESADFRNNNVTGSLPDELCELTHLTKLDVSGNLLTGKLPTCFGSNPASNSTAYVLLSETPSNKFDCPIPPAALSSCSACVDQDCSSTRKLVKSDCACGANTAFDNATGACAKPAPAQPATPAVLPALAPGAVSGIVAGSVASGASFAALPALSHAAHTVATGLLFRGQVLGMMGQLNVGWSNNSHMHNLQSGLRVFNFQFKGFAQKVSGGGAPTPAGTARRRLSIESTATDLGIEPVQLFPVLIAEMVLVMLVVSFIWGSVWLFRVKYRGPDRDRGLPDSAVAGGSPGATCAEEDEEEQNSSMAARIGEVLTDTASNAKSKLTAKDKHKLKQAREAVGYHASMSSAMAESTGSSHAFGVGTAASAAANLRAATKWMAEDYGGADDKSHWSALTLCCWFFDKFYMPVVTAATFHITSVFSMSKPDFFTITAIVAIMMLTGCVIWLPFLWRLLHPEVAKSSNGEISAGPPRPKKKKTTAKEKLASGELSKSEMDVSLLPSSVTGASNGQSCLCLRQCWAAVAQRVRSGGRKARREPLAQRFKAFRTAAFSTWAIGAKDGSAARTMALEFFIHRLVLGVIVGVAADSTKGQLALAWLVSLAFCASSYAMGSSVEKVHAATEKVPLVQLPVHLLANAFGSDTAWKAHLLGRVSVCVVYFIALINVATDACADPTSDKCAAISHAGLAVACISFALPIGIVFYGVCGDKLKRSSGNASLEEGDETDDEGDDHDGSDTEAGRDAAYVEHDDEDEKRA
jgi:hypothetical protein